MRQHTASAQKGQCAVRPPAVLIVTATQLPRYSSDIREDIRLWAQARKRRAKTPFLRRIGLSCLVLAIGLAAGGCSLAKEEEIKRVMTSANTHAYERIKQVDEITKNLTKQVGEITDQITKARVQEAGAIARESIRETGKMVRELVVLIGYVVGALICLTFFGYCLRDGLQRRGARRMKDARGEHAT